MTGRTNEQTNQLKEACKVTGVRWAAWLMHTQTGWDLDTCHGLSIARKKRLIQFLGEVRNASWLAGALSSRRTRSRAPGAFTNQLGCQRIFAFPNPQGNRLILTGADDLDAIAEGLFRVLALSLPEPVPEPSFSEGYSEVPPWSLDGGLEASFDPQRTLTGILEFLASRIVCDAAYLAIRSGDSYHIQAIWKCPPGLSGFDIPIQDDAPLTTITANRQGLILADIGHEPCFILRKALLETFKPQPIRSWMGVPILLGQRVIGLVAFASMQPAAFQAADLQQAAVRVGRLAYTVESAIIFSEVTRYLQQLALLNELASSASLGIEADADKEGMTGIERPRDDFARRVMLRLRRVFKTDWAAVLLLSSDGKMLHEYGGGSQTSPPWDVPVASSLMGYAVETGTPVRANDLSQARRLFPLDPDYRSELAVPLKYRGRVIGALVLVSKDTSAFSVQDEQLLVVIASQMAGLFENMRLNEETRERAQKLTDSVRQLQAVRDTSLEIAGDLELSTLLTRLTRRARDLVGARGAELGFYIEEEQAVEVVVSETPWDNLVGLKIPLMAGVAGRLAAFGEPIVVSDYNQWQGRLFPERTAAFHTVAGVPLKFKGQVIGTLTVIDDRPEKTFQAEDVQLLELLAPQAAISIRNARLYQELQQRIKAQELAESRLIRSARLAAVGEMAAGIAHELNNPLTTVTGFVELALDELPPDSTLLPDLKLVLEESHRARGVVRRLLDFSRPVEDQRVRADINELVDQVIPLVNHLARTGGVTIVMKLHENLPWVSLDPNQIKQVFLNLIHNGLQAMPYGGTLSVSTNIVRREGLARMGDWITISVEDTGEGILKENLERIFEPFFSTRPAGKGTGLGLSVSYGIISSHGGFIEVESEVGKGSNFTLYLPVDEK